MSGYRDFARCVICRSRKNLQDYKGEFETTMLINSLYLTVMYCIETKKVPHKANSKIIEWLSQNDIINDGGNKFKREALLRQLRNGLAHFNLKTYAPEGTINTIKIWVGRWTKKDNRYQEFNDEEITKAICVFTFSVDQLRTFTEYVTNIVLENIDYGICSNCPYQEENENGNPDL